MRWHTDALDRIVDATAGYPFFSRNSVSRRGTLQGDRIKSHRRTLGMLSPLQSTRSTQVSSAFGSIEPPRPNELILPLWPTWELARTHQVPWPPQWIGPRPRSAPIETR